jgi:hypothetical protein
MKKNKNFYIMFFIIIIFKIIKRLNENQLENIEKEKYLVLLSDVFTLSSEEIWSL